MCTKHSEKIKKQTSFFTSYVRFIWPIIMVFAYLNFFSRSASFDDLFLLYAFLNFIGYLVYIKLTGAGFKQVLERHSAAA